MIPELVLPSPQAIVYVPELVEALSAIKLLAFSHTATSKTILSSPFESEGIASHSEGLTYPSVAPPPPPLLRGPDIPTPIAMSYRL